MTECPSIRDGISTAVAPPSIAVTVIAFVWSSMVKYIWAGVASPSTYPLSFSVFTPATPFDVAQRSASAS